MNKIRKGDEVIVKNGKSKGQRGTVLEVYPDGRVLVEGVNVFKKHVKPNPNVGEPGGIQDKAIARRPLERAWSSTRRPSKASVSGSASKMTASKVRVFKQSGDRRRYLVEKQKCHVYRKCIRASWLARSRKSLD